MAQISPEKRFGGAKGAGPWSQLFAVHLGFVSLVWVAEEQSPLSVCIPAVLVASASPGALSALGVVSLREQWLQGSSSGEFAVPALQDTPVAAPRAPGRP